MKSLFLAIALFYCVICATSFGGSFDLLSPERKAQISAEWNLQASGDVVKDCAEQIARISRLLSDEEIKLKNKDVFTRMFGEFSKQTPSKELYLKLRQLKREIMFASDEINFSEVVCVDAPYPVGSEAPHESRFKTENTASFGGKLLRVNIFSGDEVRLAPASGKQAAIWRSDLDYDAEKIVFQMRAKEDPTYNLYTVDVDGKNFKKLTSSKYNDVDPAWLPDGNIVFCTSRSNAYIRCGGSPFRSTTLARCDKNGENIYFISTNNEADFMPSVLEDGRILYTRWEYVDKNIFRVQSFWTVNPDGTNPQVYWGGQSHYPDLKIGGVQIPNTDKILFMTSGHHNVFNSGVAIINQKEGTNYPDGLYNLTAHIGWTEAGKGPWDKPYNKDFSIPECYKSFYSPYPIGKKFYLLCTTETRQGFWNLAKKSKKLKLYLADYDGNVEFLYEGEHNIVHPQPVAKRKKPRVIPSLVEELGDQPSKNAEAPTGILYSANVFENSSIPPEKGKYLRVIEHCAPTYQDGVRDSTMQWRHTVKAIYVGAEEGLGVYSPQSKKVGVRNLSFLSGETSMSILLDESHKRILGEVEIESDGSVMVEIPAMKAVYFQLLDKDRKVLQTMRSSTHVVSGESRGCLGCHATKFKQAPITKSSKAMRKPPQKLKKPFGDITFGFERYIQPILNKHCVSCHNSDNRRTSLTLTGEKVPQNGIFTRAYLNLTLGIKRVSRDSRQLPDALAGAISAYYVYPSSETDVPVSESVIAPMQVLSYNSPLLKKLEAGHNNVKLSQKEIDILKAWIDLNCPFYGEEDVLEMDDVDPARYAKGHQSRGLAYPPLMRSCPDVNRAFRQDKYKSQDDRIKKTSDGKPTRSIIYQDGVRKVIE